ncbi:MAG: alpha/beta hydrolase family protein [Polaromonas sp.]|uniref:alpha/beta hydrolase family protein n=1 Tax=Polaromonas sp. TaxID=1869339 RepID=UPI004035354B
MHVPVSLRHRATRRAVACCIAWGCVLAGGGSAHARLVEEVVQVPVKVVNGYGKEITQDIVVTLFHDDALPKPYPVLVLGHGRAPDAQGRAALGRARYSTNSRWLTRLGFLVAVPTRVGYGESGGEDVEDTGDCQRKNYPPGYAAAAAQTLQVLDAVRQRDDAARDRAVVLGQSFGGATSITVAALNPPGIQAAINFAGGGGGNPKTKPQDPCGPGLLERMFATYGKTAGLPTLWIYTENDMYFGPKLPRQWFDAFKAAGGTGDYMLFPANGEDGHPFFTRAPELWQPTVLAFLRAHGYPGLAMPKPLP